MDIAKNIETLLEEIPSTVKLVAVSKTKSNEEIMQAYNAGQRVFGENKIQEMSRKYEELPKRHSMAHDRSCTVQQSQVYGTLREPYSWSRQSKIIKGNR